MCIKGITLVLFLACPLRAQDLELQLTAGRTRTQSLQNMYLSQVDSLGNVTVLAYPLQIQRNYSFSSRITLNPRRFVSHEFFYAVIYGHLQVGDGSAFSTSPLRIREAGYNFLWNFIGKNRRIRPFVAVGPSLTSFRYQNLDVRSKNGDVFKLGLRYVGTIKNAFDRAGVAPLDGGSVFRMGLNYGGGLRVRLTRQIEIRADYRATFASNPDFFNPRSLSLANIGLFTAQDRGYQTREIVSFGIGFVR
jgi:hypothetical protein